MTWVVALLMVGQAAGVGAKGDDAPPRAWTFEDDPVGALARGFEPGEGRWVVAQTPEGRVLAQEAANTDLTFNLALVEETEAADVDLSVRVRAIAGAEDQGGGLAWRARDARNYYVVRWNPLEDDFRVFKVVDGVRTLLQLAPSPRKEGWRTVRVVMRGDHLEGYLDGAKRLDVHDETFAQPGQVGVWTKADARSHFDDLTLRRPGFFIGR